LLSSSNIEIQFVDDYPGLWDSKGRRIREEQRIGAMESPAEKFHHPYSPYDIQLQFMRELYGCLEKGKIGIFESPTGEEPKVARHIRYVLTMRRYCM
jgi:hypothetical protein